MRNKLRDLYSREPARINALVASVVMAGALAVGVVLDEATVAAAVGAVLSLLLTGEGTRSVVSSPAKVRETEDSLEAVITPGEIA